MFDIHVFASVNTITSATTPTNTTTTTTPASTTTAYKPLPPSNLQGRETTSSSIRLSWDHDVSDDTFTVHYRNTAGGGEETQTSGTSTSHTITGLSSATSYVIWVVAEKDGVQSEDSDTQTFSTGKIINIYIINLAQVNVMQLFI